MHGGKEGRMYVDVNFYDVIVNFFLYPIVYYSFACSFVYYLFEIHCFIVSSSASFLFQAIRIYFILFFFFLYHL